MRAYTHGSKDTWSRYQIHLMVHRDLSLGYISWFTATWVLLEVRCTSGKRHLHYVLYMYNSTFVKLIRHTACTHRHTHSYIHVWSCDLQNKWNHAPTGFSSKLVLKAVESRWNVPVILQVAVRHENWMAPWIKHAPIQCVLLRLAK